MLGHPLSKENRDFVVVAFRYPVNETNCVANSRVPVVSRGIAQPGHYSVRPESTAKRTICHICVAEYHARCLNMQLRSKSDHHLLRDEKQFISSLSPFHALPWNCLLIPTLATSHPNSMHCEARQACGRTGNSARSFLLERCRVERHDLLLSAYGIRIGLDLSSVTWDILVRECRCGWAIPRTASGG